MGFKYQLIRAGLELVQRFATKKELLLKKFHVTTLFSKGLIRMQVITGILDKATLITSASAVPEST